MVFSSNIFLFLFLPLVIFCHFLIPVRLIKVRNLFLLATSLIFYGFGEVIYFWLLLFSISGNYVFGIWICNSQNNFINKISKKIKISIALIFNLTLLLYFKYAGFVVENLAFLGVEFSKNLLPKHLPIGISFFTFHAISYLIDIYRKKSKAQRNILTLALYISFFPQLVAGPIVRYNFIEKYLFRRRQNWFFISYGIRRFIIGLGKKIIIANPLGEVADAIFSSSISEIDTKIAWIGIICYSLQIYFDFSGYSDMAVGLARIFGFRFPENFNYPYIAKSIKEFWRRWHISLSTWFRDYVYIPLGGNKVVIWRQYFNLILVFFLCGLWHGASWNFIVWGLFHGFFLVFERFKIVDFALKKLPKILQHFYMIFVIMIGWVFFRSVDLTSSFQYLSKMFIFNNHDNISFDILKLLNSNFTIMIFIISLISFSPFVKNISVKIMRKNKIFIAIFDLFLLLTLIFSAIRLSALTHNPFIYFQF